MKLNYRQQRVFDALKARSAPLAGMYALGLRELAAEPPDGCENARVSLICHCFREIQNGLPHAFEAEVVERPNPSSASLLEALPSVVNRAGANLDGDEPMVAMPLDVVVHLRNLTEARAREDVRNSTNFAMLLTGDPDGDILAWPAWRSTSKFFVRWAHVDRDHRKDRQLPTNDELEERIKIIEDVIDEATAEFFPSLDKLDGLIAAANDGAPEFA